MSELFTDPFVTHVYKAALHTLNGHPKRNLPDGEKSKKRKRRGASATAYRIPPSFDEQKLEFFSLVKKWDTSLLQSLVLDKYAGPLFQVIIEYDIRDDSKTLKKSKKDRKRAVSEILLFGKKGESEGESHSYYR
jgi:hypothetical protein